MNDQWSISAGRPFLEQLDESTKAELHRRAHWRDFRADQVLSRQGEPGTTVLVVDSGLVKVTVTAESGREVVLGLYGSGELLGETSALLGTPRSATVVGHLPGAALHVSATAFRDLLKAHPSLYTSLLATAGQRLRHADGHRLSLAAQGVRNRVAVTLLAWAEQYGSLTSDGVAIGLRASRRELAQVVVASEKTVDDVLTELKRAGLVGTGRRRFVVKDLEGLRRWAHARDLP